VFYFKLFANLPEEYAWLRWAGFALFLNMCLGVSDITIPIVWCPLLLATQFGAERKAVPPKLNVTNLLPAGR
jgi:hypothetical protein